MTYQEEEEEKEEQSPKNELKGELQIKGNQ